MRVINIIIWILAIIGGIILYRIVDQVEYIRFQNEFDANEYAESIENSYEYVHINYNDVKDIWTVGYANFATNETELTFIWIGLAALGIQATRLFFAILLALGKQNPEPLKRLFLVSIEEL